MARLNDPPVPVTESLDALKRRFIRQNREIARVNSTQSQRIRNLEIEISRLLAENIALREQAIAIAAEADKWRTASRIGKEVLELKSRLQSKLLEVNTLVEELGGLPEKAARRSRSQRKSGFVQEFTTSPNGKDRRNRQTLSGEVGGERDGLDGRLPAILEDKYYPRRTLEVEELRILAAAANIGNEDTESPDLGPPPIAHFEVADPIAFDSAKSPKRVSGGIISGEEDVPILPKNLETRRKRRTSSLLHDMSSLQSGADELNQGSENMSTYPIKSTVKRKFDSSDLDLANTQPPQNDGFEYSRRASSIPSRAGVVRSEKSQADRMPETQPEDLLRSPQKGTQARKALAPKSTNSPTKRAASFVSEKTDASTGDGEGDRRQPTRRAVAPKSIKTTGIAILEINEQTQDPECDPKTPAPMLDDIKSPPSSAVDVGSKPKSTEAAITNSVEDVLNGSIGRGSRRAKSAVSYAEPNLRDKMRRPDKKLVGAIEGINKTTNLSEREFSREQSQEKNTETAQSASGMRIIRIKSEKKLNEENNAWKNLPEADANEEVASPLKDKEKPTVAKSVDMVRKKRTFSESEGTRTKQNSTTTETDDRDNLEKAISRLSMFDPPDSSPASESTAEHEPRRQSSISAVATMTTRKPIDRPTSAASTTRPRRNSVQPPSNPASNPINSTVLGSSTVHHRSTSTSSLASRDISGKENANLASSKLKRSTSVQALPQSSTLSGQTKAAATAEDNPRSLGSRRRSMMV